MNPSRAAGPEWSARWRVSRSVAAVVGLSSALFAGWGLAPKAPRAAVRVLERLPADTTCGHPVGQLAALAQGEALPADACLGALGAAPLAAPVLLVLARDGRRPWAARASALNALAAAERAPEGLLTSVVVTPQPPPALRRAAWELGAARDEAWVERGVDAAVHGLYDRAAARSFADGAPAGALGARRALLAMPPGTPDRGVLSDVYRGLGTTRDALAEATRRTSAGQMPLGFPSAWTNALWVGRCEGECVPLLATLLEVEADREGEEPGPPAATVAAADAAIDALYTDGEQADHVREELAAVAAWVARPGQARRAARLVAAVLHPGAEPPTPREALAESGDLHAALVRGGSTPGATALAAADLALASGVPLTAWVTDRGVALEAGGALYRVEACAAPRAAAGPVPAEWRPVPTGGLDALALIERAGWALRARDVDAARAQLAAARSVWSGAPGLDAVEGAVLAAGGALPPAPDSARVDGALAEGGPVATVEGDPAATDAALAGAVGVPGPGTLFVSRPVSPPRASGRRRAPPPPVDSRATHRAALLARAARIRALTPDPEDRARAAWWAAASGDLDLARTVLQPAAGERGPSSALGRALRAAAARAAGEPAARWPDAGAAGGSLSKALSGEDTVPNVHTVEMIACPSPYRAEPPLSAWAGGPATVD